MARALAIVIQEINEEREYAQTKWPSAIPVSDTHYFTEWMAYGREYLNESFTSLAHDPGHQPARKKLIKAVSLLLHALQCDDSKRTEHITGIFPVPLPEPGKTT